MLKIKIPKAEFYDERSNEFIETNETELILEHSLISVSKWEAIWHKPFLNNKDRTKEESISYVKCMTINQVQDEKAYALLTPAKLKEIDDYINDTKTATWINKKDKPHGKEIITSELIYYWMIEANVPFECQKWHLNRLLMLIEVVTIKRAEENARMNGKKPKTGNIANKYRNINAARRAAMNTKG